MKFKLIYITCKDAEEARSIGRKLVEMRLAACTNVWTPMFSTYWWEGEVVEDIETVLIAKTVEDKLESLIAEVKKMHSYDVPCIISLPIEHGNGEYLNWLKLSLILQPSQS